MKKTYLFFIVTLTIASFWISSCVPSTETVTITPLTTLAGTMWKFSSYGEITNLTPVLTTGNNTTLTFTNDLNNYGGSDGCNTYGGSCKIEGNTMSLGQTTMTAMYCNDDPPGINKQIQTYHDLLQQAQTYSATSDELIIFCNNGQSLQFSRFFS